MQSNFENLPFVLWRTFEYRKLTLMFKIWGLWLAMLPCWSSLLADRSGTWCGRLLLQPIKPFPSDLWHWQFFWGGMPWEYFLFIGSFTVNHTGCAGYQVKSAEYNSYNSYNSLNFVYFLIVSVLSLGPFMELGSRSGRTDCSNKNVFVCVFCK